jgi:pimeloyl-ACP methyl ester carboxylesterase
MSLEILEHSLPDGRRLSFVDTGPRKPLAIVFFHGFPGSCTQGIDLMKAALPAESMRLISIDRPGLGGSSLDPQASLLSVAQDLQDLLTSRGVSQTYLLGISGGAPYATAMAALLSEQKNMPLQLKGLGLVCPLPSLAVPENLQAMGRTQGLLKLYRSAPWLGFGVLSLWRKIMSENSLGRMRGLIRTYPSVDRKVLAAEEAQKELVSYFQSAMVQGVRGLMKDLDNYLEPWPFETAQIKAPIKIWHGTVDTVVPYKAGEWYQRLFPQAIWTRMDNEGHFSLPILYMRRILTELIDAGDRLS